MKRFAASFMLSVLASPAATTALVVSRNEFRLRRSHHVAFSSMASQHSRHVARTAINLPQRQSTISMHMGHSHSHHDHRQETTGTSSSSSSSSTVLSNPNAQRNRRRRLAAMLIFCAVAILGPPYWKHRALSEADIACFSVSAVALWAVGPVREQIKGMIRKLRDWSHGISRHSTGTSPWSFFQSNTAADRVTLLGYVLLLEATFVCFSLFPKGIHLYYSGCYLLQCCHEFGSVVVKIWRWCGVPFLSTHCGCGTFTLGSLFRFCDALGGSSGTLATR